MFGDVKHRRCVFTLVCLIFGSVLVLYTLYSLHPGIQIQLTGAIQFSARMIQAQVYDSPYVSIKNENPRGNQSEQESALRLKPVIIIPGSGGSQLYARSFLEEHRKEGCVKNEGWFRLWLDVINMRPGRIRCLSKFLRLDFDRKTGRSSNARGLQVRVPGWGKVDTIEYIDPSWAAWIAVNVGSYFSPLIKAMKSWGYRRNIDVLGAPYDWRLAPHSHDAYFRRLRQLVQQTSDAHGGAKVVLLAHSLGGLFAHYFLTNSEPAWKSRYIDSLVAVAAPWRGSMTLVNLYASGYNWDVRMVDPLVVRYSERSYENAAVMFPRVDPWTTDRTVVMTTRNNYTLSEGDTARFFTDLGLDHVPDLLTRVRSKSHGYHGTDQHPGVPTWCLHGEGVPTVERLLYGSGYPDSQPKRFMGPGDGTINLRSLAYCNNWLQAPEHINETNQKVFLHAKYSEATFKASQNNNFTFVKEYSNSSHNGILAKQQLLADLKKILFRHIKR